MEIYKSASKGLEVMGSQGALMTILEFLSKFFQVKLQLVNRRLYYGVMPRLMFRVRLYYEVEFAIVENNSVYYCLYNPNKSEQKCSLLISNEPTASSPKRPFELELTRRN